MTFTRFLARRLTTALIAVAAVLVATFLLVRLTPDPVAVLAGPEATPAQIQAMRQQLGLDRSVAQQFLIYAERALAGDFGRSWISGRPVLTEIAERAPFTVELLIWGIALGTVVGVAIGLQAAYRRDGWFDQVTRVLSLAGFSIPTYFLGLLMLLVFFYLLQWAPPGMGRLSPLYSAPPFVTGSYVFDGLLAGKLNVAWSAAAQLVLPVCCIAIICAAPTIKQVRALALDALESDYIRYGRAQGMPAGMLRRMVLRNCLAPIVTFVGLELVSLMGTTAIIEYVFSWGGLGHYGLSAIIAGDFNAVQGYVLTLACFCVAIFLAVDLIVLAIEPRSR
ncbi:MAG: ABC transporter permease [Alphaproteobacteria bacterium]|nr:ABC transporter permease [Alphaproteobacteria bacterium]